jgi:hypothetical protein
MMLGASSLRRLRAMEAEFFGKTSRAFFAGPSAIVAGGCALAVINWAVSARTAISVSLVNSHPQGTRRVLP